MAKSLRRVTVVLLTALALWPLCVWWLERAPLFDGMPTSSCGGFAATPYVQAVKRARPHLEALRRERGVPGLSVAVAVDGHVAWREGIGYAHPDSEAPACTETLFRAASVSKLFTVAAMARAVESGVLDLDAPVQRWVPGFPVKGKTVTPRLLASHRAGIRAYHDDSEAISQTEYPSVTASLTPFRDDPLAAEPNSRFLYSNYGFVLLSAAIEGATGEEFLSYVRREVFSPLAMTHTVEERAGVHPLQRAAFYDNVTPYSLDGRTVPSPPNNFSGRWASGGFLSTPDNLVRFGSAHVPGPGALLQRQTLATLMKPVSGLPPIAGYGLGWMTASDLHGRRVRFHFGAGSGSTALLAVWPRQRVVLAIMGNLGHAKFPFNRLASLINPFFRGIQPDQAISLISIGALAFIALRRQRRLSR